MVLAADWGGGGGGGGSAVIDSTVICRVETPTCPSPAVGMSTVALAGPISLRVVKPLAPRPKPGT